MARTDASSVNAIMQSALNDSEIEAVIEHANRIVTRKLGGEGLTSELLTDIETWLTAHLIATGKERQPQQEKIGDIWLVYNKNPDGFLKSTDFGQMVLFLDTSGKMGQAELKKARIKAIKQTDWRTNTDS